MFPHRFRARCTAPALAAAILIAACGSDRQRPGPPVISLEVPPGNVIASPDTLAVRVRARDDNGLDSVVVSFLGERRDLFAFSETELVDVVFFAVPEGRVVGEIVEVQAYALDLLGGRAVATATLTIIARDDQRQ